MKHLRLRSREYRKPTLAGALLKGVIRFKPRVEFAKYRLTGRSELSSAQEYRCARRIALSGSTDDMFEMLRYRRRDIAQERIAEGLLARFNGLVKKHNSRMKEWGSAAIPGVIPGHYIEYLERDLMRIVAMVERARQILKVGALTSEQAKKDLRIIRDDASRRVTTPFPVEALLSAIVIIENKFDDVGQRKQRELEQLKDVEAVQGMERIFDELEGAMKGRKRGPEDIN